MNKTKLAIFFALFSILSGSFLNAQDNRAEQVINENQYMADQGDGTFLNPILPGRYADPSVIRVGRDFYMTSSGGSANGLLIWQSRDLVNWKPLARVNTGDTGRPWAPDLVYADGMFFIYVTLAFYHENKTRTFGNYVFYADRIEGPWSNPIDLNIKGLIDPGHISTPDGKRFLHLSSGMAVPLNDTGDETTGELQQVYKGWDYPQEWIVECPCLESPKLFHKDGFYYLVSAMGGTSGPSTSHMAIVARSENPMGPWENSPYNPLIRTQKREEPWWSTGHATLIDDYEGQWWAVYHGYQNGFRSLGRQTLLLPVSWTDDGWPVIPDSLSSGSKMKKPVGENIGHGMVLSDNFVSEDMGIQWGFPTMDCKCNFMSGGGELAVQAHGTGVVEGALTSICPVNTAYEAFVCVEIDSGTEGGLLFFGERGLYSGMGLKNGSMVMYSAGSEVKGKPGEIPQWDSTKIWFKIVNIHHDLVFYYSSDGESWEKIPRGLGGEVLGRCSVALYGFGTGNVIFRSFSYKGLQDMN